MPAATPRIIRDFIPEGEQMTPAERGRAITFRKDSFIRPNFIPDPNEPERAALTREEKAVRAQEAALRRQRRSHTDMVGMAKQVLQRLGTQDAIARIEAEGDSQRAVFIEAELTGLGRPDVLAAFKQYLPTEPAPPAADEKPKRTRRTAPKAPAEVKE